MIIAYQMKDTLIQEEINSSNQAFLKKALWIDLLKPSPEEKTLVKETLGINLPTREQMQGIEISGRLYVEKETLFMTATMIAQSEGLSPVRDAVSFIISPKQLISIRYIEPLTFDLFAFKLNKLTHIKSPVSLFTEFLEIGVDRLADVLEKIHHELEDYSNLVFLSKNSSSLNYQKLLKQLGKNGGLNSKIVETIVSFTRLMGFFDQSVVKREEGIHLRLHTLNQDIHSLCDHASFLSNKISFLLDATLGLVQIEQNSIMKILSIAAVIFLPPMLIASIYGMNFQFMPELSSRYGFPIAITTMLISSWLPYKFFKYMKWF